MDLFSHALLPYLLGHLFKRRKEEITALVLGGIAPDFDVLILWINYLYPTFFLITHRGITHSLFFGFFTGLAVLYLASSDKVRIKIRSFVDFEPAISRRTVAFAYAGVVIHLFLDYVTTKGVPIFYPLATARWSAEVFFYTDIYLTIVSLAMVIFLFKKPLKKNTVTKFLAIFLVIFAMLGALRMVEKNSAEDLVQVADIKVYPTMSPFDWYVLNGDEDKIRIYEYNGLDKALVYSETISRMNILSDGKYLNAALDAAGELPQIKMFKWRAYAVAVNASSSNGVWILEYYDPLQRVMFRESPGIFRRINVPIKVKVEGGKAVIS